MTRGLGLNDAEAGANLRNGDWKEGDLLGDGRVRGDSVGFTDRREAAAAMVCLMCPKTSQNGLYWRNVITSGELL